MLLQSCCGPCSTAVITFLKEKFDLTLFFMQNNLSDKKEFDKRLDALKTVNKKLLDDKEIVVVEYSPQEFLDATAGLENEKEGGKRCEICIRQRIFAAAEYAEKNGFPYVASTLSVSPHKNVLLINKLGREAESEFGVKFYNEDFKKNGGYLLSVKLSKEMNLYRQNFCGCINSKNLKNNINK